MAKQKSKSKKSIERPYSPQFENDPTPERVKQAGDQKSRFKTDGGRKVHRLGSILDYMLGRGQIDGPQFTAGQMAYQQWYAGGLAPTGAVDLSKDVVDCGAGSNAQDHRLTMVKAFGDAMHAIGPKASKAFRGMVCREMTALDFGRTELGYRDRFYAANKAYGLLITALKGLEIHYAGSIRQGSSRMRSVIADGAKPSNRPDLREDAA